MIKEPQTKIVEHNVFYNKTIYESANDCLIWLNKYAFEYGKAVVMKYLVKNDDGSQTIEELTAVGVSTGLGYNNYRILNVRGCNIVADILEVPNFDKSGFPDVAQMVHGEVFVLYDPVQFKYSYVYHSNPYGRGFPLTREIVKTTQVTNLADGITYILKPGSPLDVYQEVKKLNSKVEVLSDILERLHILEETSIKIKYLTEIEYLEETLGNTDFQPSTIYFLKATENYTNALSQTQNLDCIVGGYWRGHPFKFGSKETWSISDPGVWKPVLEAILPGVEFSLTEEGVLRGAIQNQGASLNSKVLDISVQQDSKTKVVTWTNDITGATTTEVHELQIDSDSVDITIDGLESSLQYQNGTISIPVYYGTKPSRVIQISIPFLEHKFGSVEYNPALTESGEILVKKIEIDQSASHFLNVPSGTSIPATGKETFTFNVTHSPNLELTLISNSGLSAEWSDPTEKTSVVCSCPPNYLDYPVTKTIRVQDSRFSEAGDYVCDQVADVYQFRLSSNLESLEISNPAALVRLTVTLDSRNNVQPRSAAYPFAGGWEKFGIYNGEELIQSLQDWEISGTTATSPELSLSQLGIQEIEDGGRYRLTVKTMPDFTYSDSLDTPRNGIGESSLEFIGTIPLPDLYYGVIHMTDTSPFEQGEHALEDHTELSDFLSVNWDSLREGTTKEVNFTWGANNENQSTAAVRIQSPIGSIPNSAITRGQVYSMTTDSIQIPSGYNDENKERLFFILVPTRSGLSETLQVLNGVSYGTWASFKGNKDENLLWYNGDSVTLGSDEYRIFTKFSANAEPGDEVEVDFKFI